MEFVWSQAQDALIRVLKEATLADAYCSGHFPFTGSSPGREGSDGRVEALSSKSSTR
jgi:hypothetical protein